MPSSVEVAFAVDVDPLEGYEVGLVGDAAALGSWNPQKAVKLKQDYKSPDRTIWMCTISLLLKQTFHYRFFICKSQTSREGTDSLAVYKWETNVLPRSFKTLTDLVEETNVLELPIATFGSYDGFTNISKGWLTQQSEVQLHLHPDALSINLDSSEYSSLYLWCVPLDLSGSPPPPDQPGEAHALYSPADVLVSMLTPEDPSPHPQSVDGSLYCAQSFMSLKLQVMDPSQVGFQMEIFANREGRSQAHVGTAFILPQPAVSQLTTTVPVTSNSAVLVGSLTVSMLTIYPFTSPHLTMETSYQSQWVWGKDPALDIGHRGMGSSYRVPNPYQENTIASFNECFNQGGDFVELDVLVTKDGIPVVYHDFQVGVTNTSAVVAASSSSPLKVAVKDLTVEQLHTIKINSGRFPEKVVSNPDLNVGTPMELRSFPTLEVVLEKMEPNLGINLEVKYPQKNSKGQIECPNYTDLNITVDIILSVLMKHVKNRKIVFSCFEADCSTVLRLKQNKYPVLLLSEGETSVYDRYLDYRASTFERGICWTVAEQLNGMSLLTEVLLKQPCVLQKLKQLSLISFVWGNNNNDPKTIRQLRELGVDAVIYDRMDLHKPEKQITLKGEKEVMGDNSRTSQPRKRRAEKSCTSIDLSQSKIENVEPSKSRTL